LTADGFGDELCARMILGTGIDIVEVDRIRGSFEKFGERFVNRILCPAEITYCLKHRDPAPYLAARFAAKEAISKAFGTGIGAELGWQDMEIGRKPSGEPFVILHANGVRLLAARQGRTMHLSLSHTQTYAAAVAILEGQEGAR
jgi:holo-[acyl-carrier protein] synthase